MTSNSLSFAEHLPQTKGYQAWLQSTFHISKFILLFFLPCDFYQLHVSTPSFEGGICRVTWSNIITHGMQSKMESYHYSWYVQWHRVISLLRVMFVYYYCIILWYWISQSEIGWNRILVVYKSATRMNSFIQKNIK